MSHTRVCETCEGPIPATRNARAKFCSTPCKSKKFNARSPERDAQVREYQYVTKYGITIAQYDEMFLKQKGQCAICGTTEPKGRGRFAVDHDHKTGQVRALLCTGCNIGLGHFQDDPALLRAAADYIDYIP